MQKEMSDVDVDADVECFIYSKSPNASHLSSRMLISQSIFRKTKNKNKNKRHPKQISDHIPLSKRWGGEAHSYE